MDAAALAKARRDLGEQRPTEAAKTELASTFKEEFASRARSYIVSLLAEFLNHVSLNADIVKGMATFDPHILLGNSMEQATQCLTPLFRSLQLRGWLEGFSEADCREEYVEFIDHFRYTYSALKGAADRFTDMVDLLVTMPELQSRPHLYHLFRLSCLCLSEDTVLLPAIKFHDVDAQSPRCRLRDVLLPAQSYLATVPNGVAYCTSEASLEKFIELEQQFNSGSVSSDPWSHVDSFGYTKFQKILTSVYMSSYGVSKGTTSSRSASESDSTSSTPSPRKSKRKVVFGPDVTSGGSNAGKGVRLSSPKPNSSKD